MKTQRQWMGRWGNYLATRKQFCTRQTICSWHLIPLGSPTKQLQMQCLGIKFITLLDIKMAIKMFTERSYKITSTNFSASSVWLKWWTLREPKASYKFGNHLCRISNIQNKTIWLHLVDKKKKKFPG